LPLLHRPPKRADRADRRLDVVLGVPELDIRPEQSPERAASPLVRETDTPGVDDAQTTEEPAVVLHMGVTADEDVGFDRPEQRDQLVIRSEPRINGIIGDRRRVAYEDAPETADVELERQRPRSDGGEAARAEALFVPRSLIVVEASNLIEPISVPTDDSRPDSREQIEDLGRPWPGDAVTRNDDCADILALDVREDGLECRQVPVDVAQGRYPHGGEASVRSAVEAPRR